MQINVARNMADEIKAKYSDMVAVIAVVSDGKLNFITACGTEAVKAGVHAGKLAGEVSAVTGGKGGGRPDSAMAGGRELEKVDAALETAKLVTARMIGA